MNRLLSFKSRGSKFR